MTRDPRVNPQPGDVLVFRDGTDPSLGRIESVGDDGMVRWRELGERWAFTSDDWPEYCRARKATVLEGTGPLTLFRWRPGGALGGEMPENGDEIVFVAYGLVLIGEWDSAYRRVNTKNTDWLWRYIEWYVPVEDLMPKEEPHDA